MNGGAGGQPANRAGPSRPGRDGRGSGGTAPQVPQANARVIPSVAEESRRPPLTPLKTSRFLGYARNDIVEDGN